MTLVPPPIQGDALTGATHIPPGIGQKPTFD